jgi:hypothetical protein
LLLAFPSTSNHIRIEVAMNPKNIGLIWCRYNNNTKRLASMEVQGKVDICTVHKTIIACNETNLMHYLSSIYTVTIPLHVSGLLVAHHQEVTMYTCNRWYVLYVLADCQLASVWFHYTHISRCTVNKT